MFDRENIKQGFTLIELSIVLVIIGLIVAGILVGQELIRTAEVRATVKQFEQFNVAVQTFRLKYNCLPGDCRYPVAMGFPAASAGNQDGFIGECSTASNLECGFNGAADVSLEYFNFWYHLSAASFIPYTAELWTGPVPVFGFPTGINTPTSVIPPRRRSTTDNPGGWGVQADVIFDSSAGGGVISSHALMLAALLPVGDAVGLTPAPGGYSPMDAFRIDQKVDDGLPINGTVRAWSGFEMTATLKYYTLISGPGGPSSLVCVDTAGGDNQYNVTYAGNHPFALCNLAIRSSF